jgi:hypothetical protein
MRISTLLQGPTPLADGFSLRQTEYALAGIRKAHTRTRKESTRYGRSLVAEVSFAVRFALEPEFAVRRLAAALAALAVHLRLKLDRRCSAELVDVTTGKARAVRAVPVLLEKH